MKSIFVIITALFLNRNVISKPAKGSLAGPCANAEDPMACLHGMLMHGDTEPGHKHTAEDNYLKFKSVLETKDDVLVGPNDPEKQFHGMLMHGDTDAGIVHVERGDIKPEEPPKQLGPEDVDTYMHGMLMHGDEKPGHDHTRDHIKDAGEQTAKVGKMAPMDGEQLMHGLLMHGDGKTETHHVHDTTELPENDGPIAPRDPEDFMHGLMHNGEHVEHDHGEGKTDAPSEFGPNSNSLHGMLMHGDATMGDDHHQDHAHNKEKPFTFDLKAIRDLNIDEDILKSVGLDMALKELDDYQQWLKDKQQEELTGTSFASISDSILSDIEVMKIRYLARMKQKDGDIEGTKENHGITAEEAKAHLAGKMHVHDNDDMEHDLELVGSTGPINSRHTNNKDL